MREVLNLYKKPGETPLECLERFRALNPEYGDVSMTYAGRLDPLASGVLVVLAGDSVHKKEEFLGLNKKYEVEVLFGFETDTFDVLGLACPPKFCEAKVRRVDKKEAEMKLGEFAGKNIFEYPPYSSKTINGKPLFAIARADELQGVEIPQKEIEIYSLNFLGWREIDSKDLLIEIEYSINSVKGDFRQEISLTKWKEVLKNSEQKFFIAKIEVEASSGAYMRTLAYEWGKKNGIPALAYKIIRTKVGEFEIKDSVI